MCYTQPNGTALEKIEVEEGSYIKNGSKWKRKKKNKVRGEKDGEATTTSTI